MATTTLADQGNVLLDGLHDESLQLVEFGLADEIYGIEITKVREIILMREITRIPQNSDFIKGVINLRGVVIPIVDLRLLFDLGSDDVSDDTRIIVVNANDQTIGLIVDNVNTVMRISRSQIDPPPPTVMSVGEKYLVGLAKLEEKLAILLDIDAVLDRSKSELVGVVESKSV